MNVVVYNIFLLSTFTIKLKLRYQSSFIDGYLCIEQQILRKYKHVNGHANILVVSVKRIQKMTRTNCMTKPDEYKLKKVLQLCTV